MTNYKPTTLALFLIAAFFLFSARAAMADYMPEEMCVIPWGDGPGELKIAGPSNDYLTYPPGDSGDGWEVEQIGGPERGFVDRFENFYFVSSFFTQLKAFGRDGHLICDYSKGASGYKQEFYDAGLRDVYVDSLSRVFIHDELRGYLVVVDTTGRLLEKLTPFPPGLGIGILNIHRNHDDILTFETDNYYYRRYSNGIFTSGGSSGWLAKDGNCYYASLAEGNRLRIIQYRNPDISGAVKSFQEYFIQLTGPDMIYDHFLGVDDRLNIYALLRSVDEPKSEILMADTSFIIVDQIAIPRVENKYRCAMDPFMRPSDGNIYEFRCLDDGLHVIRWKRE